MWRTTRAGQSGPRACRSGTGATGSGRICARMRLRASCSSRRVGFSARKDGKGVHRVFPSGVASGRVMGSTPEVEVGRTTGVLCPEAMVEER